MNPSIIGDAAKLAALKTNMQNTPALAAALAAGDDVAIAAHYNAVFSPDFWVRRTRISKSEIYGSTSQDGTVFTFNGNGYITRAQGERDAWVQLFDNNGFMDASLPQNEAAILDIFSGTGNAAANRAHIAAKVRRKATVIEKLYATGTGSTGSNAIMGAEGPLTYAEVSAARTLP